MATKREYGSGGISWLSNYKVRLRVWIELDGEKVRRSKVVKVAHRDHGGRGEATAELDAYLDAVALDLAPGRESRTLEQVIEAYIVDRKRLGKAAKTIEAYEDSLERLPAPLRALPLSDLTAHDLDAAYGQMTTKGLGDNTIRAAHAAIRASLNQAIKWGWAEGNPADNATVPARHRPVRSALAPSAVFGMAVKAATPRPGQANGDAVLAMAIVMASLTGARRGELAGLRWDDLDAESCSITIQRQWVPGRQGQDLKDVLKVPSKGARTVYLGPDGLALLEQYRSIMRQLLGREPAGWLLSSDAGTTPANAKSLGQAISRVARGLGFDSTTHTFRRVSATELMAAGVDPDTGARRLGHSTEVMISDYVLGADDQSVAAAGVLEARLIERGMPIGDILGRALTPPA